MKKRLLSMILAAVLVVTSAGVSSLTTLAQDPLTPVNASVIAAPTENLKANFWLDQNGTPYYNVVLDDTPILENAKLGLNTSIGDFKDQFTLTDSVTSSADVTWSPVVGEKEEIRDHYNQTAFKLTHASGKTVTIEMRAYDTGVAFRYILPKETASYKVSGEYTQFVFPAGSVAQAHAGGNQTIPSRTPVESFSGSTYYRPMTVQYPSGAAMTICEANLDNYGVMTMVKDSSTPRALKAAYASYKPTRPSGRPTMGPDVVIAPDGPASTPWRAFVVARELKELPMNSDLVLNLNEAPDEEKYGFSEWVEAGSVLRAASGMNTTAIKNIVDQAKSRDMKYVLLDTGWYGPEFDVNCDPRLDPSLLDPNIPSDKILLDQYFGKPGEGKLGTGEGVFNTRGKGFDVYKELGTPGTFQTNVDIPEICDYANKNDIGIILYVNGVYLPDSSGRGRFGAEEIFSKLASWGVKGVKPGFVHVRAQEFEKYMQTVVETAAKYKMVMTVHDEYVITGTERTFPNLLTVEGILGDEGIGRTVGNPQVAEDIGTLFTRPIQGPADHTYCYPGKATKAYALASPIMFKTGLQVLYWYTNPASVPAQDKDKMDIWKDLPGSWDELNVLEAKMREYATYARRKGTDWYIGSLSAITRDLKVPLDFVKPNVKYVAEVYADGADADPYASNKDKQTLEFNRYIVDSTTVLNRSLKYGFGYAVKLHEASAEEIAALPEYNPDLEALRVELGKVTVLNESEYTSDSWVILADAMKEAEKLLASAEPVSKEEIQAAVQKLQAGIAGLRSTAELKKAIKQADLLTSYHYSATSWKVLEAAIADAEKLLEGSFNQAQIDSATKAISDAIAKLEKHAYINVKNTTYLSNLEYDASKSYAYNNNIFKDTNRNKNPISLIVKGAKKVFDKGMYAEAQSEITYHIGGQGYELFEAYVGVDNEKSDMGDVIFKVWADDVLIYETKPSGNGAQEAQFMSVPIAGVNTLRLEGNMNGVNSGDWAAWADAKFLVLEDPDATLEGIYADGTLIPGFNPSVTEYYYPIENGQEIPVITAIPKNEDIMVQVIPAEEVPGTTVVEATKTGGEKVQYKIHFRTLELSEYLSDLTPVSFSTHGSVLKDIAYNNNSMSVTAANGVDKMTFAKGIGAHAKAGTDSTIVYDIAGKGFAQFQSYVGISYDTNDSRSSVIFKIFADDETTPRYTSPLMKTRTPAEFVDIDVSGVKKLRVVLDPAGDMSADHSNLADAKFLSYVEPAEFAVSMTDVENVVGEAGSTFDLPVKITKLPSNAAYKSIEGVLTIPDGLTVQKVLPSAQLENISFDCNMEGNTLRFAFVATDPEHPVLTFDETISQTLLTLTMQLTEEKLPADTDVISFARFTVKSSNVEEAVSFDVSKASSGIRYADPVPEITAMARELYSGDGVELISETKKAIAVEFTGIDTAKAVSLGETTLFFSSELTEKAGKNGALTYIALVDASVDTASLSAESFLYGEAAASFILFGDVDGTAGINAQDALKILRVWLRKDSLESDQQILIMNVNADTRLDTSDAVAVVDRFVSGKDFAILDK